MNAEDVPEKLVFIYTGKEDDGKTFKFPKLD